MVLSVCLSRYVTYNHYDHYLSTYPFKEFMFVKSIDSTNVEDIQMFMEESVKGCKTLSRAVCNTLIL